ncbi:putative reverse transcriptase zinc-binding domain-containing protein [Helianthus annuus]|uniref:Reverse transcriptase zinc-binding domain-containing protein n=1 Tax=Helianthus annuus TaxID=4232 RepID=A0A9K3J2C9_HELAN|nr:putative reverse transcriptase zinc-binding domain-containing protein [Helianthus annuus]KAJ0920630.1 putative reverse transcriptase zinc-binding domain-containing protein [Helianthus annuus]
MFPLLFQIESNKRCWIRERYNSTTQAFSDFWEWNKPPSSAPELAGWRDLTAMLDNVSLSNSRDRWEWIGGDSVDFSVKAVKEFLKSEEDYSSHFVFKWSKWVPKKCNILLWRAEMGMIATVDALVKRNFYNGSDLCSLCEDDAESAKHIFYSCSVALSLWYLISRWCRINPIYAFSIRDLSIHEYSGLEKNAKEVLQGIIMMGC